MAETGHFVVLFLVLGIQHTLCANDLSLTAPHSAEGVKGDAVNLPCTYTPSDLYTETEVLWYFESQNIFHRIHSEDSVMLSKFQNRVVVSTKPGDVSLTLRKLTVFDRGAYICKVIWTSTNGERLIQEETITLNVQKERKHVAATEIAITEQPVANTDVLIVNKFRTTAISKGPTSTSSQVTYTTEPFNNMPGNSAAATGSTLSLYILLLIAGICALSIVILIIVFLVRQKRKHDNNYQLPTMNQLMAIYDGSPTFPVAGCQSNIAQTPLRMENDYHPEPCLNNGVGTFSGDYEAIQRSKEGEYELLITERPETGETPQL
ncbi:V-set and immunoglobulin domain-containing protein 4 isoform X2 [Bombina bombina]|uniref:V-set and immunoglobulin domain-containing protein 4 isoform X2 n=1 Tax=Bombina bombina TaxID=8345 RepID=UPI00235A91EA|nr:V-set and immunoglobulin domain-containing protein 4 isoform X2 [Bombina bombina]